MNACTFHDVTRSFCGSYEKDAKQSKKQNKTKNKTKNVFTYL